MGKKRLPKRHQEKTQASPAKPKRRAGSFFTAKNERWFLPAMLAITFIIYLPVLQNDFTNYDDQVYVTENPLIAGFDLKEIIINPVAGNYHPLTILTLAVNYAISGLEPFTYHLVNLLFHLLNMVLVFYFFKLLCPGRLEIPVIVATLFAIHPMHVESVAWISERKDVLYVCFFMAGMVAYLKYLEKVNWRWFAVTLLLFFLSVISKPAAVIFPVILLLVDYYLERRFDRKALLEKVPFFLVSLLFGWLTIQAQAGAAIGSFEQYTIPQRIMFAAYGIMMYIMKLFVPLNLSALHPYPDMSEEIPVIIMSSPVFVIGLLIAMIVAFRKNRAVIFGTLFFLISIALVLQFVSVGRAIFAERYTYLSYLGLFFMLAYGYSYIVNNRLRFSASVRKGLSYLLLFYCILFSYQTFARVNAWQNSETLWSATINVYPDDWYAYLGRANYYLDNNQMKRAFADYNRAVEEGANVADPYIGRGNLYRKNLQYDKALSDYNKALSINSLSASAYSDRGSLYFDRGEYDKALEDFEKAINIDADIPEVYSNIGSVYSVRKNYKKGLGYFNKAINLNPLFPDAYLNRAILYTLTQEHQLAANDFQQYFRLIKGNATANAWFWAGVNEQELQHHKDAVAYFTKAININPNVPDYYAKRARSYQSLGDNQSAEQDLVKSRSLGG